ncbi:MAG: DNA-processing protein DprA [Coriobacteriales bacterium]|nr:DNA-processing protein DprA [Coriobacteriales bacterium]
MEVNKFELRPGDDLFPEALLNEAVGNVEVLYGIGDPNVLAKQSVSIIGARQATPYGIAVSSMAGRVAGESGIVVVSGGAMGCDCAASAAALDAGGQTIIVSGCGADRIYPSSSEAVFRKAVAQGGAIVAIEPWGTSPRAYTFPKRNVIIAALSSVLIVAEAGVRSGTMSTADAALQMDRTIYAVPGSIFSPTSQGTNRLIMEGALPICNEVDLETRLSLDFGVARMVAEGVAPQMGELISALVANPMRPDELATRLGQDTLTLLRTLTDYEARGVVEHLVDGRYSLTTTAYENYRTAGTYGRADPNEVPI